eukprot:8056439-Lingulodinium_polyedra.AAC.1
MEVHPEKQAAALKAQAAAVKVQNVERHARLEEKKAAMTPAQKCKFDLDVEARQRERDMAKRKHD